MANFSYKTTTTTTLKVCGIIDVSKMTVDIDGYEKKLATLFADFNGGQVEINIKIKNEEELDEPSSKNE